MNKTTLDILIDALSEQEWQELKNRADAKKAFTKVDVFRAKRESAIQFGDWILKHNVVNGHDMDGSSCWVVPGGGGDTYTSLELYNIYLSGRLEVEEWEDAMEDLWDMSDWDVTLNDGLEELDS